MAVITLSVPASEIRGSLGGTTFRSHAGKTVVLRKPSPRSGQGRPTLSQRRWMGWLMERFSGLTAADRLKWAKAWKMNSLAEGIDFQKRFPSVQSLYVHQVMEIQVAGGPFAIIIPTHPGRARPPLPIFAQGQAWQVTYNFAYDPLLTNQHMIFYVARICPASQTNPRTWTTTIGYKTGPYSSGMGWSVPAIGRVGMVWKITAIRYDGTTGRALLHSPPTVQFLTKTF